MSDQGSRATVDELDLVTVDPTAGKLCHVPLVQDGVTRFAQWDLCWVCGAELLTMGSRWSLSVCLACKEHALDVNTRVGRCLVPIARHSFINGVAWERTPGVDPRTDPTLRDFVERFQDVMGGVLRLERWRPAVIRRACRELAFDEEVSVAEYLRHAQAHVDTRKQLDDLLEWLAAGATDEGLPS